MKGINDMQQLELNEYAKRLCAAKDAYNYPYVTYNFNTNEIVRHKSMLDVERLIQDQLLSPNLSDVKDGLSNVLYWGYATTGYQWNRVCKFRVKVTSKQLREFKETETVRFPNSIARHANNLHAVRKIKMSQFSGMSFLSKLLMFLNPDRNPVLDMKLATFSVDNEIPPVGRLKFRTTKMAKRDCKSKDTQIRLSSHNMQIYQEWALCCGQIAETINSNPFSPCGGLRAVDVERAIFWRIIQGRDNEAQLLLAGPAMN